MFYIKILNPTLDLKLDIYFVQNNIWLIVLILDQKNLFTQILLRTPQFSLGLKSNSTQNLSVALPAQLVSYYFEIIYRLSNIFYKIRETQLLSHNLRVTNFFYHFVCIMLARVRQGSGSWDHNFLYHAFIMFKDIGTILFSCEKLFFFPDSGCPLLFAERGMLESVSCHFHEGMAGIKLLTAMPSSQQNNSSHSSMGSGSGSRHFHEGHSRL